MAKILFGLLITIFLASVDALPAEKIRISVSGGYNMIFRLASLSIADFSKTKASTPISLSWAQRRPSRRSPTATSISRY
jgi:hypothetical protein